MSDIPQDLNKKRKKQIHEQVIFVLLLIAICTLLAWIGLQTQKEWDLSRSQRHSLSNTSIELLQKLDGEINFIAFVGKNPEQREQLRDLIGQYQKQYKAIRLEFIDPDLRPDLTRKYGIQRSGEVRVSLTDTRGQRSEILRDISEVGISNALLRLGRNSERYVLFVEGHGERNPFGQANHDLRQFAQELSDKGYDLQRFNLSQGISIPENTRLLVIASPQLNYLAQEVEALQQYLISGGNFLWLSDPDGLKGLESLLAAMGLNSPSGTVIDQGTQTLNIADASFSLISNYNQHPALSNFNVVSLFPQARAFTPMAQDSVWQLNPFLITQERTWLETDTLKNSVSFDAKKDLPGPLHIGYSLVRDLLSTDDESAPKQQRIIVIGDGDFLSNRFLANGANLPLGLNLVDWLSGEESFLNIHFAETPDINLNMSERALGLLGLLFLFILPGLCFLIAASIWWRRRNS